MLLCSAFKNFVGDQRAAWRMVNALRKRAEDRKTYGAATAQEVEFAVATSNGTKPAHCCGACCC